MANENEFSLQQNIQRLLKATEDSLLLKTEEQMKGIVLDIETINKTLDQVAKKQDIELVGQLKADVDMLNANLQKNQVFIDNFITEQGKKKTEASTFEVGW